MYFIENSECDTLSQVSKGWESHSSQLIQLSLSEVEEQTRQLALCIFHKIFRKIPIENENSNDLLDIK